MTEKQFEEFLKACHEEVYSKQKKLTTGYELNKYTKYIFCQKTKCIEFINEQDEKLAFEVECIGSWDYKEHVWIWAWANDHFSEVIREEAKALKELETITGYQIFAKEGFNCEEAVARDLAYMGVYMLKGIGIYRITVEDAYVFLALKKVKEI